MRKHLSDELIDQLLSECPDPGELLGEKGLLHELTKRLLQRALAGEMTTHLGYEKHERPVVKPDNARNGYSKKTVISDMTP